MMQPFAVPGVCRGKGKEKKERALLVASMSKLLPGSERIARSKCKSQTRVSSLHRSGGKKIDYRPLRDERRCCSSAETRQFLARHSSYLWTTLKRDTTRDEGVDFKRLSRMRRERGLTSLSQRAGIFVARSRE